MTAPSCVSGSVASPLSSSRPWSRARPMSRILMTPSAGGGRQTADIINGEKRVVVLAKGELLVIELLLDEVVAVEVIRRLEGKERRHPHDHGAEDFIADVEVVVGEAALLAG